MVLWPLNGLFHKFNQMGTDGQTRPPVDLLDAGKNQASIEGRKSKGRCLPPPPCLRLAVLIPSARRWCKRIWFGVAREVRGESWSIVRSGEWRNVIISVITFHLQWRGDRQPGNWTVDFEVMKGAF